LTVEKDTKRAGISASLSGIAIILLSQQNDQHNIRVVLGLYMLVSKIIDSKFGTLADFSYLCPIETKNIIVCN
jgi:hypothetical protein